MNADVAYSFELGYVTTADGARLAYGLAGEGQRDILFLGTAGMSFEASAESPLNSRWWDTLSVAGRVIGVDLRGIGRSDPLPPEFSCEDRVRELALVLDEVGIARVTIVGLLTGGALALLFASLEPERVESVIVCDSFARFRADHDYPYGLDETRVQAARARYDQWGTGGFLAAMAPARADDAGFRRAAARLEGLSGSPAAARALFVLHSTLDLRERLPAIKAPTLVLEHAGRTPTREGAGQDLAARLPNATYIDLGADLKWTDHESVSQAVLPFLTGERPVRAEERVLTAVLVTDIVGSTSLATRLGDAAWRQLLDAHDRIILDHVLSAGGRVVKTTGDGALAVIPTPSRALRCARAIQRSLHHVELDVRCGLHVGEVEARGDDIGGVAVHVAARVAALASAGEVIATDTVAAVVAGTGFSFHPVGTRELKGLPGSWSLVRCEW